MADRMSFDEWLRSHKGQYALYDEDGVERNFQQYVNDNSVFRFKDHEWDGGDALRTLDINWYNDLLSTFKCDYNEIVTEDNVYYSPKYDKDDLQSIYDEEIDETST